jgi:hypothetical protein
MCRTPRPSIAVPSQVCDILTRYKVPTRGLFRFVCCPHYLFELVSWMGVALVFGHPLGITVFWMMLNYLCGRAHVTLKWYATFHSPPARL